MPDPFESSRYALGRAEYHIGEFEREVKSFMDSHPMQTTFEVDPDGTIDTWYCSFTKPLPANLPGIAFDALGNMRAALDQVGHAVALAAGKSGKKAGFPFGDTPDDVEVRRNKGSRQIPREIFDVMVGLRPYRGGNNPLWVLNKLRNRNAHELITPIGIITGASYLHEMSFDSVHVAEWPPRWNRQTQRMVLAVVPHGAKPRIAGMVMAAVAFDHLDVISNVGADGVMRSIEDQVKRSINVIEAEARRIGLVE